MKGRFLIRCMLLIIAIATGSATGGSCYTYDSSFGSPGSADGQFYKPTDIVLHSAGESPNCLFVVDSGNHRVQYFRLDGTYLGKWGSLGSSPGQFTLPIDMAAATGDAVWVVDVVNQRVQKIAASTGAFLLQIGETGMSGDEDGLLGGACGVAVTSAGDVLVCDSLNYRIQRFDGSGNYLRKFGSEGTGNGEFKVPQDVGVDSSGNIYVLDSGNNRVQKFDSAGHYLSQWGSEGTGDGQFHTPSNLYVDAAGNVWVSDSLNNRVQKFTSSGAFITKFGSSGSGNGQFNGPAGLVVDSEGNVYVCDADNNRVQKWVP